MTRLAEHGVRFAMDDFGSGHSSLTRLKDLPTQIIKLNRCFASEVDTGPQQRRDHPSRPGHDPRHRSDLHRRRASKPPPNSKYCATADPTAIKAGCSPSPSRRMTCTRSCPTPSRCETSISHDVLWSQLKESLAQIGTAVKDALTKIESQVSKKA